MSVVDALSAVKGLYKVVEKVKENKTELKRLIGRIEHVVQALEDSKARDVIREDEYNDGLNTISDLIRRSEKLGQRMLKRSLGDRTWNAGEIAAEIKSMNEDVQTYLSVHSVSLLHWLGRAQLEQYNSLATSVQDVVVKVFRSIYICTTMAPVSTFCILGNLSFSCLRRSIQTIAESNIAAVTEEVATQVASSKLRPLTAGETDVTRLVKSARGDVRIFGLKRASNPFKEDGKITLQGLSNIPDWNNISERLESAGGFITLATRWCGTEHRLHIAGFVPPDLVEELNFLRVKIVDGDSTFNASSPEGLRISQFFNRYETVRSWWSRYQDYHGMRDKKWDRRPYDDTFPVPYTPGYTRAELVDDGKAILVAGVKFEFHRTFRIPDSADEITQSLPPSLGQFPMVAVSDFTARLPDNIRERGGFLIPMFNREALWINFCKQESEKAAVKVSVGGVNAVSGEVKNKMSPPGVNQDYIVSNQQPWLDGVRTSAGVVRQFVVAQLGEGYTVEEQITGTATEGGFQFDSKPDSQMCGSVLDGFPVFPELPEAPFEDIRLKQGRKSSATLPHQHDSWDFQDYRRRNNNDCLLRALYEDDYSSDWDTGAQPRALSRGLSDAAPGRVQPLSRGQGRGSGRNNSSGVAVGGRMTQKIFKDADQPSIYDENQGQRFHVHIVSPEQWEEITGVLAPITPITTQLYAQFNLPWFSLYENFQEDISHVSEELASLKSVSAWDEINTPSDSALVDPDHPGDCSIHTGQITTCVFRPCGHAGCSGCLGAAMLNGSKCTTCNAHIERFVGTTQPVPVKVSRSSDGDAREWSVSVIESLARQTRDRATVEIIQFDPRDRVSPLFRSGSQVVGLSAPVSTTQKRRGKTLLRK
ncbi:hypothetical protein C8R46DRAFT_911393 [Mycena filopes]|nr:hypothetical protein C8R46DRAFT_911393 [Mycena filopes]